MKPFCPRCVETKDKIRRNGFYLRSSDGQKIQRYFCLTCNAGFSASFFSSTYKQKKRQLNPKIYALLSSGVSQRRIARLLRISRLTVERKFIFLSYMCLKENWRLLAKSEKVNEVQFDDMETMEHTKLKPLSITLAVEKGTRRILSYAVSEMPAKGLIAKLSRKKYGRRKDERQKGLTHVFSELSVKVGKRALIESDENPFYETHVKRWLKEPVYIQSPGQRGSVTGQGELKKIRFDPLFSINHTCAMFRANMNRLFRKTWCTTKKKERLLAHIHIYAHYHNTKLLKKKEKLVA